MRLRGWMDRGEIGDALGDVLLAKAHMDAMRAGLSNYAANALGGYDRPVRFTAEV